MSNRNVHGFTLLEVLLTVALIAILAGIVILALNPGKQLADTRNARRRIDVETISNAVYQYIIDNNGSMPMANGTIPVGTCGSAANQEICQAGPNDCISQGKVDLTPLTTNQKYLTALPVDPSGSTDTGTRYYISQTANGRISVCAPQAEEGVVISITR